MMSFDSKKQWLANNCPYGVEYYCDGTPNKSLKGWKVRKPIGKCPQRKNGRCELLAQVRHYKKSKD